MPHWLFVFALIKRRLWLTVGLYCALGVAAALVAALLAPYVPADFPLKLGSDAVDEILSVLASSMLAVATFSLAALVTVYTSVVGNIAPRAANLLVADGGIRNVLATFVGAFVFAIVGIIAVHTGYYGAQGRVILFFVTLFVLLLVVLAMVRWIGHLSELGQVDKVVQRVADVTAKALRAPTTTRSTGQDARRMDDALPVHAEGMGYVQNIDVRGLQALAAERSAWIYVEATPGTLVHPGRPLMWVRDWRITSACAADLRGRVALGRVRTFDQDPLFGMQLAGEIAAKALSPGLNHIGVAREVIGRTVGTIHDWITSDEPPAAADCPRIALRPVCVADLLREALAPIAGGGAASLELQIEFQEALAALDGLGDEALSQVARELSELSLQQTLPALSSLHQRERLLRAVSRLFETPSSPRRKFRPGRVAREHER